nr:MAG TPA: hypothetical protein [Caudoviricetes sp.]
MSNVFSLSSTSPARPIRKGTTQRHCFIYNRPLPCV